MCSKKYLPTNLNWIDIVAFELQGQEGVQTEGKYETDHNNPLLSSSYSILQIKQDALRESKTLDSM